MTNKLINDLNTVNPILANAPYNVTRVDALKLLSVYKVSYHDSGKIEGIFSFDSSCHGSVFCGFMRSLAEKNPGIICGLCYDAAQEKYKANVKERHTLNLRIMSSVLFAEEELSVLTTGYINRFNSSGDIDNLTQARNYIRIAKIHPLQKFALWSKNFDIVAKALDIEGKPENMIYIASSTLIDKPAKLPKYADYTFTVYSTEEKLQEAINTGSVFCGGKKCKDCGFKCYFGLWPIGSDIAELLRK